MPVELVNLTEADEVWDAHDYVLLLDRHFASVDFGQRLSGAFGLFLALRSDDVSVRHFATGLHRDGLEGFH